MGKVLHASKSGYFPFCLQPFSSEGSFHFTTATLENAMRAFWVLRSFSITGSYNTFDSSRDFNIVLSNTASTEEEIVCNPIWEVSSYSNLNTESINGSWYSGNNFYTYGDLIVPDYSISAIYEEGGGAGFAITSLDYSDYAESFSLEGMTFYGTSGGASGFSINPISYWSYGETYDTTTGESL
jgi:hypothetical protein